MANTNAEAAAETHQKKTITDVKPPPAVGSKIRVHTFPENDESKPAEWFPAVVCRCHPPPKKNGPVEAWRLYMMKMEAWTSWTGRKTATI